jgi:hypothetical protein
VLVPAAAHLVQNELLHFIEVDENAIVGDVGDASPPPCPASLVPQLYQFAHPKCAASKRVIGDITIARELNGLEQESTMTTLVTAFDVLVSSLHARFCGSDGR